MFERYTGQARRVVGQARAQARALNHGQVGTVHILLGLICEREGPRPARLHRWESARAKCARRPGRCPAAGSASRGRGAFLTPRRAKTVLEQSTHWAPRLGDNHVGTGHILPALTEEAEGGAARVLARLGADPEGIRRHVMRGVHARRKRACG